MKPTILIVDDSIDSRLLLSRLLNKLGYTDILMAETGEEVLHLIEDVKKGKLKIDLVLLDIIMPGMDGIEVCDRMKEIEFFHDVPVIMVTGLVQSLALEQAFEAGAVDYIKKPIDPIELRARIRSALLLKAEMDERKKREEKLTQLNAELQELNQFLEQLSMYDGLTGIPNRRKFDEYYEAEWNRMNRSNLPLSVIMLDLDHFKLYNDTYGHQDGDDTLRCVAKTLTDTLHRSMDLAARYGGEEFVVVLPETPHDGALIVAEAMRSNVEKCQIPHQTSIISNVVTISVGVATIIPTEGNKVITLEELLEEADKVLYLSKKSGRNRVSGKVVEGKINLSNSKNDKLQLKNNS